MGSDTLVIKKMPCELSNEEKITFLKDCGAVNVNILGASGKRNVVFARFPSEGHAKQALHHLHQQEVLGSFIVVEYARSEKFRNLSNEGVGNFKASTLKETGSEALLKKFLDKLNSWTTSVDFRVPIPAHLNYHYPPPTPSTLENISMQLAKSTKLYTQVLHLMNKMNLPCPFVDEPPLPLVCNKFPVDNVELKAVSSETESEISSGEENIKETIPAIKPKEPKVLKRRRVTRTIISLPTKIKKTKIDDVFEDPKLLVDKKRVISSSKAEPNLPVVVESEGFGFIYPLHKPSEPEIEPSVPDVRNEMEEERLEKTVVESISLDELKSNRISEKDRTLLPVFKNYAEGAPTCRLYVKNLAKQTTEDQLKYIYSRFLVEKSDEAPNTFDVRLMQEGRMKGQAFITLQTVEAARQALDETNGFILNDKPMVVQFARSAVKKL